MTDLPSVDELEQLRDRLRLMRAYIARLESAPLNDLDALLSVAEAEVERAISASGRQAQEGGPTP